VALLITWLEYIGVGLAIGSLSGLLGVGGGIIAVPMMVAIWKLDPKIAIGTSLATMIPTAIAGSIRHYNFGNVNLALAACLAIGTVVGSSLIGAPLADRLPSETLKRIFGILMVVSGLKWSGLIELVGSLFHKAAGG